MPQEQYIEQSEHTDTGIWNWVIYREESGSGLNENLFQDEHNTNDETNYLDEFRDVETQIDDLISLPENWDSYNANTICDSTINRAKRFIHDLFLSRNGKPLSKPFVSPLPDGSIQFEWNFEEKEIEFLVPYSEEKAISYLLVENDSLSERILVDSNELNDLFD